MILYYAMGGGLGHLTRSLAILNNAPDLSKSIRLMASSKLAPMVSPMIPCPVDIVDDVTISSRKRYYKFLKSYIETYRIRGIVLDTFPCGIVGEWEHIAREMPRILIARYLKPTAYFKKIGVDTFLPPTQVLSIEPLEDSYLEILNRNSRIACLNAPIILSSEVPYSHDNYNRNKWLIVHSGSEDEGRILIGLAKEKMSISGYEHITVETCFKEDNIYPAERIMPRYSVVISGAGYNMVSVACMGNKNQEYILHPFKRRFDDQFQRVDRYRKGEWLKGDKNGTKDAAMLLSDMVKAIG